MADLLLGADVGGTATRAAVADAGTGLVLGTDTRPSGNPNVVGTENAAQRIRAATTAALGQAGEHLTGPAAQVRGVVLGMGGYGTARAAGTEFARSCVPDGVTVVPRIVPDFAVAYASATPEPHGYVVVAGTGAVAAEVDRAELIRRRDGWGWLLGDQGSGFWIGREATRCALGELQRQTDRTEPDRARSLLCERVLDWFDVADLNGLLGMAYQIAPRSLADLTPLVAELADTDDTAADICHRAGGLLADLVDDLGPEPGRPVVTGGSVLHHIDGVRTSLGERLGRYGSILAASSGLLGALWAAAGTGPEGTPVAGGGRSPSLHHALSRSIASFEFASERR